MLSRRHVEEPVHRQTHYSNVRHPRLWILLKTAGEKHAKRRRKIYGQRVPIWLLRQHQRDRVRHVFGIERPHPGQHLIQNNAEGPDVGALVYALAFGLLWAHVRRCPKDHSDLSLACERR